MDTRCCQTKGVNLLVRFPHYMWLNISNEHTSTKLTVQTVYTSFIRNYFVCIITTYCLLINIYIFICQRTVTFSYLFSQLFNRKSATESVQTNELHVMLCAKTEPLSTGIRCRYIHVYVRNQYYRIRSVYFVKAIKFDCKKCCSSLQNEH